MPSTLLLKLLMGLAVGVCTDWAPRLCEVTLESYKKCFIISKIFSIFASKFKVHQQAFEEYSIFD